VTDRVIEGLLAASPLFADLPADARAAIAGCGVIAEFAAGTHLGMAGAPADAFYVIREGRVALELHGAGRGALVVETLAEGEVVGWSWLIGRHEWQFDVRTLEPTRAIVFDATAVRARIEADHELGYQLLRRFAGVLVDRLQHTRVRLLDVYGDAG
jgi:CRP-like cAMP-binding protein